MDKLIYQGESNTQVTISNDGATIIRLLNIIHPAAKILTDIARAQDDEVGDGTTSVVLLACEFLRMAKPFVEDGVHPRVIVSGYRKACAAGRGCHRTQELCRNTPLRPTLRLHLPLRRASLRNNSPGTGSHPSRNCYGRWTWCRADEWRRARTAPHRTRTFIMDVRNLEKPVL